MIRTDKDGGMAVCSREEMFCALAEGISPKHYRQAILDESLEQGLMTTYSNLCKRVYDFVEDEADANDLRKQLVSDLYHTKWNFACSVLATCKTHKQPGKVGLRIIHSGARHPWRPIMRWVSEQLRVPLGSFNHILRDTADFLSKLSRMSFPRGTRIIKLDVRDFFMSGSHETLAADAGRTLSSSSEALRQFSVDMIEYVIGNQYIRIPGVPMSWRVTHGSGMGLSFSGELADASLLQRLETPFMLTSSVRKECRILAYFRFKDDIIIFQAPRQLGQEAKTVEALLSEMNRRAHPFVVEVDEIATYKASFLDVSVFFGGHWRRTGRMDTEPYRKPSSIWTPLSSGSLHHPTLHNEWPKSMIRRYHAHSTSARAAQAFVSRWIHDFQQQQPLHSFFNVPESERDRSSLRLQDVSSRLSSAGVSEVWLVVPYCPEWGSAGLPKAIRDAECVTLSQLRELPFRVRIAWGLGGQHLINRLAESSGMSRFMARITRQAISEMLDRQRRELPVAPTSKTLFSAPRVQ